MVIANVFPKLQTVKNFVTQLCQKRRSRTRLESEHVKVSRIIVQSPWQSFYDILSSFWRKLIWKFSPLALAEI